MERGGARRPHRADPHSGTAAGHLEDAFIANGEDAARLGRITAAIEGQPDTLRKEHRLRLTLHRGWESASLGMDTLPAESASLLPQGTPAERDVKSRMVEAQRSALRLWVEKVVIDPTALRGRVFDEASVDIRFRDPDRLRWQAIVEKD